MKYETTQTIDPSWTNKYLQACEKDQISTAEKHFSRLSDIFKYFDEKQLMCNELETALAQWWVNESTQRSLAVWTDSQHVFLLHLTPGL